MTLTLISETMHTSAQGGHQQIQPAISIDISENGAGGDPVRTPNPGGSGHFLKLPSSEISIEGIGSIDGTKIKITPSVPIKIARRNPRAVHQVLVLTRRDGREEIGEAHPRRCGRNLNKTRMPGLHHRQWNRTTCRIRNHASQAHAQKKGNDSGNDRSLA